MVMQDYKLIKVNRIRLSRMAHLSSKWDVQHFNFLSEFLAFCFMDINRITFDSTFFFYHYVELRRSKVSKDVVA